MNIVIEKDWDWYLAKVEGKDNYFAFWYTPEEALSELKNITTMTWDFYERKRRKKDDWIYFVRKRKRICDMLIEWPNN